MFGIDVSQFQGTIDWERVKPQISFAILRLGWIGRPGNHTLDAAFERNYYECSRLGIPVGVYVYNYSDTAESIRSGAEWTLDRLWGRALQLPVYLDMEDETLIPLGRDTLTGLCVAYNTVIERGGYWAGVYANYIWFENYLDRAEIRRRYTTWIADYRYEPEKYKGEYDMWQYSDRGQIDGIQGPVDTNILYRDLIREIEASRPGKDVLYTVRPGDTLWLISQRFHVPWQEIARKNGLADPDRLTVGQVLRI